MNTIRTTVLLGLMVGLFLVAGNALGGRSGMVIAFIFAMVMNVGSYWFSDRIVLAMYGAKEVTPQEAPDLHYLIDHLCEKAQIPTPRIYVIQSDTPNAFATGRDPAHAAVAVTHGILNLLNREELEGVLAHELSHVRNRDILISTIAAAIAGAITMLAHMAQWAMMFGGFSRNSRDDEDAGGLIGSLLMLILAPLAALLIQLAISRTREYGADRSGGEITGNPMALASALRKLEGANRRFPMPISSGASQATAHMFIVNPFKGNAFTALFSTHPPIDARIERLQEQASTMGWRR